MQSQNQSHPFVSHRLHFQQIPNQQRTHYRKMILSKQPMEGQPKLFKTEFQNKAFWQYKQNVKLNYYHARTKLSKQPKAILFYFHGMNSHGGSFGYIGTNLVKNCNLDVYALDFQNFGLSEGPTRGYIPSLEESVTQAQGFIDYIMPNYKQLKHKPKIIISGLSFGGTICFKMATSNPQKYDLAILFSPGLRQVPQSMPILKQIGKCIGYLFPTTQLLTPTYTDGNKYNMAKQIQSDQRNYLGKMIPGSVRTVLNGIQQVSKQYSKLKTPYILFQSGTDKLVDVFAPLDLQKQCPVKDKMTIYCKDMWHSVFSQEEVEHIVPIVIEWVNKRIGK